MGLGGIYNIAFVSFDLTGGPKLSKKSVLDSL
jgi:hypothetical protein